MRSVAMGVDIQIIQKHLSPPDANLYASVLFRPSIPPRAVAGFSFVASFALSDAIKSEGLDSTIKSD